MGWAVLYRLSKFVGTSERTGTVEVGPGQPVKPGQLILLQVDPCRRACVPSPSRVGVGQPALQKNAALDVGEVVSAHALGVCRT